MKEITKYGNNEKLNLFLSYMLDGRDPINEEERKSIESSFFAMELLVPTHSFIKLVEKIGSIELCYTPYNLKVLSQMYYVEEDLIKAKLKSLTPEFNKKTKI